VVGIAPCEIASVATTAMAGGAAALSAAILIGSTLLTIAFAGMILSFIAHDAHIDAMHVLTNLVIVVGIPLTSGVLLAATKHLRPRIISVAERIAVGSLAGLILLVAGQVHLGADYVGVLLAVVIIVGVSAFLGSAIGRKASREGSTSLLLTMSMRDFAIAAALAAAAFGPQAVAPLGLYGVLVIFWGTAVAGFLRSRAGRASPC
jgi:predicted Na+-dependent transporter